MKASEPLTHNFRRRPTSASTNSSAKRKSCCLLRTLSNFVALCATRLCYFRMVDRSILAISTKPSNDMPMGPTSLHFEGVAPLSTDQVRFLFATRAQLMLYGCDYNSSPTAIAAEGKPSFDRFACLRRYSSRIDNDLETASESIQLRRQVRAGLIPWVENDCTRDRLA